MPYICKKIKTETVMKTFKIFVILIAAIFISTNICACKQGKNNHQNANDEKKGKTLVAYFSATGTTARAARQIAEKNGGELFEIIPAQEYTDADLDWNDKQSRSSIEMSDAKSRPELKEKKDNMGDYDVVYIGYPIWWGVAPRIINTFIESHDLNGKRIIPFATSGGSGIEHSVNELKTAYPDLNWEQGKLF